MRCNFFLQLACVTPLALPHLLVTRRKIHYHAMHRADVLACRMLLVTNVTAVFPNTGMWAQGKVASSVCVARLEQLGITAVYRRDNALVKQA